MQFVQLIFQPVLDASCLLRIVAQHIGIDLTNLLGEQIELQSSLGYLLADLGVGRFSGGIGEQSNDDLQLAFLPVAVISRRRKILGRPMPSRAAKSSKPFSITKILYTGFHNQSKMAINTGLYWSGRSDSNTRPPAPKAVLGLDRKFHILNYLVFN